MSEDGQNGGIAVKKPSPYYPFTFDVGAEPEEAVEETAEELEEAVAE